MVAYVRSLSGLASPASTPSARERPRPRPSHELGHRAPRARSPAAPPRSRSDGRRSASRPAGRRRRPLQPPTAADQAFTSRSAPSAEANDTAHTAQSLPPRRTVSSRSPRQPRPSSPPPCSSPKRFEVRRAERRRVDGRASAELRRRGRAVPPGAARPRGTAPGRAPGRWSAGAAAGGPAWRSGRRGADRRHQARARTRRGRRAGARATEPWTGLLAIAALAAAASVSKLPRSSPSLAAPGVAGQHQRRDLLRLSLDGRGERQLCVLGGAHLPRGGVEPDRLVLDGVRQLVGHDQRLGREWLIREEVEQPPVRVVEPGHVAAVQRLGLGAQVRARPSAPPPRGPPTAAPAVSPG